MSDLDKYLPDSDKPKVREQQQADAAAKTKAEKDRADTMKNIGRTWSPEALIPPEKPKDAKLSGLVR